MAFKDINPAAKIHLLIIPKQKNGLTDISQANEEHKDILGHMLISAAKIGKMMNLNEGYRLVINQGPHAGKVYLNIGQTVDHIHIHLIGGEPLTWPPGTKENLKTL